MRAITTFVLVSLISASAVAVPLQLTHQGRLLDSSDQPLNANLSVQFSIYDAPAGGLEVWTETLVVSFVDGYYSVILGETVPIDENVLDQTPLHLGITIAGEALLPRHRLVSAPYAVMAGTAQNVVGGTVDASGISVDGTPVVDSSGTWVGPPVGDTLSGMSCVTGDVAMLSTNGWRCAASAGLGTNSNAATLCRTGEFLSGDGSCVAGYLDADGVDDYNADFDTEAEIDAAVANNNYSTGAHTVDTNADTLCGSGQFLNGAGACVASDASGNCGTGSVCLGGHAHSQYLSSSGGDVYVSGDYTHAARTGYLHLPGSVFVRYDNNAGVRGSINGYAYTTGATTTFQGNAPVDLPHGAIVTGVTGYFYDNSSSGGSQTYSCSLTRRALTSPDALAFITVGTTINWAASTTIRALNSSVVSHTVDEVNNAYAVWAAMSGVDGTASFRHYGCRITYTYTDTNN